MPHTLEENARAVLLPAFDSLTLSDEVRRFLDDGGVSILLGESREEYVARSMSPSRRAAERAEDFIRVTDAARQRSHRLIAAVDQEMGGICRLHDLVPAFPDARALNEATASDIEAICSDIARGACAMGVNLFLAPVLDVLRGSNPWLEGRTLSDSSAKTAATATAFIRGVRTGGVATCSKHFPGFPSTTGDPAIDPLAICDAPHDAIEIGLDAFRAAIAAGTDMMMVGPAPVTTIDPEHAALRSPSIVRRLVNDLGFDGIVMADDLDGKATLRGGNVPDIAVEALNAGCHYLLLADTGRQVGDVTEAIVAAVKSGDLAEERLALCADKVRAAAE